jgi:hypothetical protein
VRDSDDNVLWLATATASGSISITTSGSPSYFEVRFYCTEAGENTAEDDSVYGKLTDVRVYSLNVSTLDAEVIAQDIVDLLSAAGHGLSNSVAALELPGRALEPAAFDTDMTPADVLSWCAKFGDADGNPLAWGVTFDDYRRLFLETMDLTTVRYTIKPGWATLERGGDWGESAQKAYGIYTDDQGEDQRTDDVERDDVIADLGGYYRRVALHVDGATKAEQVLEAVGLWLDENEKPAVSGSFAVKGGVWKPSGLFVPFDEILPGGLVQVREWRAREASLTANDYRDKATTFMLAGVTVDEEARTAELIPRTTSDTFARHMAIIAELAR